jgi:hypothetical protein
LEETQPFFQVSQFDNPVIIKWKTCLKTCNLWCVEVDK